MRMSLCRVLVAATLATGAATADTIAIDGRVYENVLVYEGNSAYYVKIPDEGRVISAPKSDVSSSSISINNDPYYRDQLKARFDRVRSGGQDAALATPSAPSDPAFQAPDTIAVAGAESEGVTVSAGGGPMGISRQDVESILQGSGFQNQGGMWKSADGKVQVEIKGPDDNVNSVVASVTAPEAQIQQAFFQLGRVFASLAPWAPQWVLQNLEQLATTGAIQTAQDGRAVAVQMQPQGQNLTVTATISGA